MSGKDNPSRFSSEAAADEAMLNGSYWKEGSISDENRLVFQKQAYERRKNRWSLAVQTEDEERRARQVAGLTGQFSREDTVLTQKANLFPFVQGT